MLGILSAGNLLAQPATPVKEVVGSDVVTDEVSCDTAPSASR